MYVGYNLGYGAVGETPEFTGTPNPSRLHLVRAEQRITRLAPVDRIAGVS